MIKLLLNICDYSSTLYEWQRFVKVVIFQTHSGMCVISVRTHKDRHTLWLSLLFDYVYMKRWRRQFSFLKSCKATYSISCLCSYTVCVCVLREVWITALSHPYWERISCPHSMYDSQPSRSIGCLEVWVMQERWSCFAGIQTCPHPWHPHIHLLCLCRCLWGEWCNNAGSAYCSIIKKSLLCLSHIHTTPSFLKVWLIWYLTANWFWTSMTFDSPSSTSRSKYTHTNTYLQTAVITANIKLDVKACKLHKKCQLGEPNLPT